MKNPLVSVIIPNFNYARYLPEAIDSVLNQTYAPVEILVVDDGSEDDSEAVVKAYGDRVRLIKQKNLGVAAARNHGVRESNGELLAFLDADDSWLPTKLSKQVERMLSDPELGLVHCGVEEVDPDGTSRRQLVAGMEGWVSRELLLFQRPVIINGGTLIVSRASFDAVGGFDTRLSTAADWGFCYLVAARQRVGFVPEPLVKYRIHGSNMHANIKAMEHDMLICYEKAFATDATTDSGLRRRSYGNLHMVLAGSYFRAGMPSDFARHAFKSLWLTPVNVKRLLGYPLRWYQHKGDDALTRIPYKK